MNTTQKHYRDNKIQTVLLVGGLACALAIVGFVVGGSAVMMTAVVSVLSVALLASYVSPAMVLRMKNAQCLTEADSPTLFALLDELTVKAKLSSRPSLYYLATPMMTAFTVGLGANATITVSDGLLRRMNRRELMGILAHEISHIKNNDMRIMNVANAMDQLVRLLAIFGLFWLLFAIPLTLFAEYTAPWIAIALLIVLPSVTSLMTMKLSRTREFEADRMAAELTGDPLALISALGRLEYREWRWVTRFLAFPKPAEELSSMQTHPATEERIERLELQVKEMACEPPSLLVRGIERMLPQHVWELNKRMLQERS